MAKSVLQIVIQTLKEGKADKETIAGLKQIQSTIGTVTAVAGAMAAAYAIVDKVVGESIDTTVNYANEVRRLKELTGLSAEEASRLSQVMDDLKVDNQTLTTAAKTLSKEGLTLNINTLAKLSDEYKTLGTGAEKTAFLVEHFGKAGLGMAEAMEQGGNALRTMNSEVAGSLVLNQQALDSTREYERQLDNLNDTWDALKVSFGTAIIPVVASALGDFNAKVAESGLATAIFTTGVDDLWAAFTNQKVATDESADSLDSVAAAALDAGDAVSTAADAEKAAAEAAKELTRENQSLLSVLGNMQSEEDRFAEKTRTLTEERKQLEADKAAAIKTGTEESLAKVAEFNAALVENGQKAAENAAEHDKASKKIILGLIQQKLTADGNLTDDELNWLLDKGVSWGIYSQKVVDEARKAVDEANKISDAINGIPEQKKFEITADVKLTGGDFADFIASLRERDSGGPGVAGQAYVINPQAGPEVFVPNTSGQFYPNADRLFGGGGGGFVMNVNISSMINAANDYAMQAALYPVFMQMINRAKSDGVLR